MSKYFAFVGTSGNERTTLVKNVGEYLTQKGFSVAIMKFVKTLESNQDQIAQKNGIYNQKICSMITRISPETVNTIFFGNKQEKQPFLLAEDSVDYILLDGIDTIPDIPRAIITDDAEIAEDLDTYTIAIIGSHEKIRTHRLYKESSEIPKLVENLALPPNPNLNCEKCGYPNCIAFRTMILKGKEDVSNCVTYESPVQIRVNDKDVPVVPFIQGLIESVIIGMIHSLHIPDEEIKTIRIAIDRSKTKK